MTVPIDPRVPIVPPATIGMLGGGQLGRYTVLSARLMGYRTVVVDPDPQAPAGIVADEHVVAPYDDPAALDHLGATCRVVTIEFENAPAAALARLSEAVAVAPPAAAIAIAQDRVEEKRALTRWGIAVAPFAVVDGPITASTVPFPAILKTARLGYDGKGQRPVRCTDDLASAWRELGGGICVLEHRVELDHEISVIVARTADGRHVVYPPAENHHIDGTLDLTVVPAPVPDSIADEATAVAIEIAHRLSFVGVLGVEMFISGGRLLVNELAPRPHNSGHWTLDACRTSQFEQQVRAVCGLALGSTEPTVPVVAMVNLLGNLWSSGEPDWASALVEPDVRLHLYGKVLARPGRKMGHLTVLGGDDGTDGDVDAADAVGERARHIRARLTRR